jgi:hypothetical protein
MYKLQSAVAERQHSKETIPFFFESHLYPIICCIWSHSMKFLILGFTLPMTFIVPGFSQKAEEPGPAHSLFAIPAGREQSLSGVFKPQFHRQGQGISPRETVPEIVRPRDDGQLEITIPNNPTTFVQSKPYSAEETIQEKWTWTDKIPKPGETPKPRTLQSTFIYRDSEGRIRIDWPACYPFPFVFSNRIFAPHSREMEWDCVGDLSVITEIADPVAGYRYYLDSANQVAYRFSLPPNVPQKQLPHEFLGVKTINGINVQGIRYATIIDASNTVVTESWTSNELMIGVLRKSSSPDRGEIIQTLKNIKRIEPDVALFKIPTDYRIIDGQR